MPTQLDNTYHAEYSKPTYDNVEDLMRFQNIREADEIFEQAVPDLPDRQSELEYMQW